MHECVQCGRDLDLGLCVCVLNDAGRREIMERQDFRLPVVFDANGEPWRWLEIPADFTLHFSPATGD